MPPIRIAGPITVMVALSTAVAAPDGPSSRPDEGSVAEQAFMVNPVQLTFAEQFAKAGEAYFNEDSSWIIFQAVVAPPPGETPSPHYAMYVARVQRDEDGHVTGLDEPVLLSAPDSANTCGWFHPTDPGVVLFGSTRVPPAEQDAPGYSRDRDRYTWQFPNEMNVCTRTVQAIVEANVEDSEVRAELLARADVEMAIPLWTQDGYCAEASWSPDGRCILYTGVDPETGDGDIHVRILETGESRTLVTAAGYDGGPFFSPDGKFICYRSDRRGDSALQLFVSALAFDEDGLPAGIQGEFALTDNEHVNWAPYWHPSGAFLVYATSEVGHHNYEVFAMPFDARYPERRHAPVRITHADGFDGLPVFSPDGTLMMWTAQRGDDLTNKGRPSSQLWLAEVVGWGHAIAR